MSEHISGIIIFDEHGRVFLQHRDNNAPTFPNIWTIWGGHSENEETPLQTAIRELYEETAIIVSEKELKLFKSYPPLIRYPWHVFMLQVDESFVYTQSEGDYCGWFSAVEIPKLPMVPLAQKAVLDFFATQS